MLSTNLSFSSDFKTYLQNRVGWLKLSSSEELYLKQQTLLYFNRFVPTVDSLQDNNIWRHPLSEVHT